MARDETAATLMQVWSQGMCDYDDEKGVKRTVKSIISNHSSHAHHFLPHHMSHSPFFSPKKVVCSSLSKPSS